MKDIAILDTAEPEQLMPIYAMSTPFSTYGQKINVPCGLNISQIVDLLTPKQFECIVHVYLLDEYITKQDWDSVFPSIDQSLSIRIMPLGGGGGSKNPLRTVLQIALIVAVGFAAPALAGTFGTSLFGISITSAQALGIAGGLLLAGGQLLINAIAPPALPRLNGGGNASDSATRFIEGARNSIKRYGVVPVVLGKHRLVPPLAALTFTESSADKQFVRQLFTWGYGDLILTQLKIGQTLLSNFEDVETESILDGSSATSTLNLYSNDIFEEQLSIILTQVLGFQLRTSQVNADEIIVDLTFPRGLAKVENSGIKSLVTVSFEIQTAITGTGNFSPSTIVSITESTSAAVRRSVRLKLPRNQYDVRIKRTTVDATLDNVFDTSVWTAIRTVTNKNPVNFKGISLTALRIRATDQLNGAVDELNAIVSNKIPMWNGSTWVFGESNNPADIFRYVLSNNDFFSNGSEGPNFQPLIDDRVDLDVIQDWHDFCTTEGFEYNAVIDFKASVRQVLQEVAAAGRASVTIKDGKWSVIIDRKQTLISQHFTPRNTWGYSTIKNFIDIPNAFRVLFLNEEIGFIQDERFVFDDGFDINTATVIETLELPGITKPDLVWKHARQHLATLRLQPREHNFFVDVEHLIAPRGSRCKLAHDVINVGLAQGRIKSIQSMAGNVLSITLDESIAMQAGKIFGVLIRTNDNESIVKPIVTDINATTTLTFVTPFDNSTIGIIIGDLVMFGEAGKETIDIIIKEIIPEGDMVAKITARDYNEAIFNSSSGLIPVFNSGATTPPELLQPLAPVLDIIQSDEEVQVVNTDGSISSRMVISIRNVNVGAVTPLVTFRAVGSDDFAPAKIVSSTSEVIVIEDLQQGTRYDFRIRYKRIGSVSGLLSTIFSSALEINNTQFIGTSSPPPDIQNFLLNITGTTAFLKWDNASVIDFDHYIIKFSTNLINASWNGSSILQDNIIFNSLITGLQKGTYLIKAVDKQGNESVNPTLIVSSIDAGGFNSVQTIIEEPSFLGVKSNVILNVGAIELIDNSMQGIYNFNNSIDLGQVFVSRVTPKISAVGNNQTNIIANWLTLDSVSSLSGTDPSSWSVEIQIRTTNDDPNASPTFSAWLPLTIGDIQFRAAEFRLLLDSINTDVTPSVTVLQVEIDMPDRVARFEDVTIPVSGFNFTVSPPFRKILDVQITGQDMVQGDYWKITNKTTSGAIVKFFDKDNISKQIIADVQLNGFGNVQI